MRYCPCRGRSYRRRLRRAPRVWQSFWPEGKGRSSEGMSSALWLLPDRWSSSLHRSPTSPTRGCRWTRRSRPTAEVAAEGASATRFPTRRPPVCRSSICRWIWRQIKVSCRWTDGEKETPAGEHLIELQDWKKRKKKVREINNNCLD